MAAERVRTGDAVANATKTGELSGEAAVVAPAAEAAERRSLKRRGYELDFDPTALEPCTAAQESLKELHTERATLAAEKKRLTGNIKRAKKTEARLKKRAMGLRAKDLCEIIGMKSQLSKQWQAKKEKEERSQAPSAADEEQQEKDDE